MSGKILVEASEVWNYFYKNEDSIKSSMRMIALNEDYGIEIYLTDNYGLPSIIVTADDVQVCEKGILMSGDCERCVKEIYEDYLTGKKLMEAEIEDDYDLITRVEEEDMIFDRESELDSAIEEFVSVVLDGYVDVLSGSFTELCDDLKEHFLEYMARKHDLPIRRPMYLEYEGGIEEFEEFPYEHMEFEDENNPVYMK